MKSNNEHTRHLPLRLCEVLEKEFVATNGVAPAMPTWLLRSEDLDYQKLLEYLRVPGPTEDTTVIGIIKKRLIGTGVTVLATNVWTPQEQQQVLGELNRALLEDLFLSNLDQFESDTEVARLARSWQNTTLRQPLKPAEPLRHEIATHERLQLNRLLLETVLPGGIVAPIDSVRLSLLFSAIHELNGTNIRTALCLSGGGIRSAAFSLGILQGLARCGLLDKFDYLSTVSGGGYVGSWLSAWAHRHPQGLTGVSRELASHANDSKRKWTEKIEPGPAPLRFLRNYSYFLNPKSGLFSLDTWTWLGIYLRNLSLNWLVMIPALLLMLIVPRLYATALVFPRHEDEPFIFGFATLAATLVTLCISVNRPSVSDTAVQSPKGRRTNFETSLALLRKRLGQPGYIFALGVAPLLVFGWLMTILLWHAAEDHLGFRLDFRNVFIWGQVTVLAGWLFSIPLLPRRRLQTLLLEGVAILLAGSLTWLLVGCLAEYAPTVKTHTQYPFQIFSFIIYPAHLYISLAFPAVLTSVLAGMTLFIGAVSKFKWVEDEDREWWGRYGAEVLMGMLVWFAMSAITIFGPPLLLEFPKMIAAIGGGSGMIAALLGKSAWSPATEQSAGAKGNSLRALFGMNTLALFSAVFLIVFLAFLSLLTSLLLDELMQRLPTVVPGVLQGPYALQQACGLQGGLPTIWAATASNVLQDPQIHLELICQTPVRVIVGVTLVLSLFLLLSSSGINLNQFSLHAAYRIRIARTFLGASRGADRKPNPFTGFDPLDNVQMHELQPGLLLERDVLDLRGLVAQLQEALRSDKPTPAQFLIRYMCSPEHDQYKVLRSRVESYKPGAPVLTALQRDLIETLNRILETAPLHKGPAFKLLLEQDKAREQRVDVYLAHGNLIFANRLLIEAAFPKKIKHYDFPPELPRKLIHVLNLTLNLVHGKKLAWQDRKAAPFVVTPMHSGSYYLGYRESLYYGGKDGISIATTAAISGAAVSPNMGYSSSRLTALLLTLLNVRLGWWLGNPGAAGVRTYTRAEPLHSLLTVLSEAFGLTDDQNPYVYLSDGGHFENMGVYEMVLRRCRLIVATDAGADPKYQFSDIGNAVRKIRIDFGIPIEFSAMPIFAYKAAEDSAARYCSIGKIQYSAVDGPDAPDGILVCFKPVLLGKEPRDVLHYYSENNLFPQEPTSDQFFGETQFESYRQLGEFAMITALDANEPSLPNDLSSIDFINRVFDYVKS